MLLILRFDSKIGAHWARLSDKLYTTPKQDINVLKKVSNYLGQKYQLRMFIISTTVTTELVH